MVAALASWVDARANGGRWLLRMEDIDAPRTVAGAAETILEQLAAHGLEWDGEVAYQSRRTALYEDALDRLGDEVFPCGCTRQDPVCDCQRGLLPGRSGRSIKLRGEDPFILKRADGLFAYHLAVVVDDAAQGITDVVRGADLQDSTPRQMRLQTLLGYPHPRYSHVPLALDEKGDKLSKQTRAPAVDCSRAQENVAEVLKFLGHDPPDGSLRDRLDWAVHNWDPAKIPLQMARTI
jgi:glutamyl-Q tRNA(Asp) synthetase